MENETGYVIWRHTAAGGWVARANLIPGTTSYTDSGLASAAPYDYVVRAYNNHSYADSPVVQITTLEALWAPTGLRASGSKTAVTLTWTDTNTRESGYEVLRSVVPAGNFAKLAEVTTGTTYTDSSVLRGTTYYYRVRAYRWLAENRIDYGPPSATVPGKIH